MFDNFNHEIVEEGAPRRCGGIGDILGGVIASIISMHGGTEDMNYHEISDCLVLSGRIVRKATKLAFSVKRRSMSALDVIEQLGYSFEQIFE